MGIAHGAPFLRNFGQKIVIFRGFTNFFFRTTRFQLKLLILIESLNIFHWKPAKKSKWVGSWGQIWPNVVKKSKEMGIINRGFFHILHGEYLLKQKVVVVHIPEWKVKANIGRYAKSVGCLGPNF